MTIRSEVSFVPQVDININNQISYNINRDGVLISSNKYGKLYFAVKNKLYILSIESFEEYFDECEEEHDIASLNPIQFSLSEDITQLSLSLSEILLCIGSGSSIFICDARQLQPSVMFCFLTTSHFYHRQKSFLVFMKSGRMYWHRTSPVDGAKKDPINSRC